LLLLPKKRAEPVKHLGQFWVGTTSISGSVFGRRQHPEGFSVMSPVTQLGRVAGIENTIQEVAGNRKQRRMATQKALKNGRPRASFQAAAIANARNGALEEILDVFPMRPQDARMLSRYVVGDASAEDATRAMV
jgi:hypothetical protein